MCETVFFDELSGAGDRRIFGRSLQAQQRIVDCGHREWGVLAFQDVGYDPLFFREIGVCDAHLIRDRSQLRESEAVQHWLCES